MSTWWMELARLLANAAYKGYTVIVAMLLKAGADVNLCYPLHASLACPIEGNETCVFMLIQAGADIDKLDDRGRTPMQIVVEARRENETLVGQTRGKEERGPGV